MLTADGFLPTELNTRMSAGLTTLSAVDRRFFSLLQANLVTGLDPGVTVADVESLVTSMDAERTGRPSAVGQGTSIGGTYTYPLAWDGVRLSRAATETGTTLVAADTPIGFFARLDPCPLLGPGQRLAPLNVALLAFLDEEYGTGFGALQAAPDLR